MKQQGTKSRMSGELNKVAGCATWNDKKMTPNCPLKLNTIALHFLGIKLR